MKACKHRRCEEPVYGRKQYCSDHCKYWENVMKRDEEKHLPIKKYRNDNYFSMVTGVSLGGHGRGKRSGGTIVGGMSSCPIPTIVFAAVTEENLKRHFSFDVHSADLCGGGRITRKEFELELEV